MRGVKGNKVLRTVKIKSNNWTRDTQWEYFCDQTCLHDFIRKHFREFVRLHPRTECLETPILNPTKEVHGHSGYTWTNTKIEVDESRNIG